MDILRYLLFGVFLILTGSNNLSAHPGHSHHKKKTTAKPVKSNLESVIIEEDYDEESIIGSPYGLFQIGHYNGTYFHPTQKNHIDGSDVSLSSGATIGSTFYKDKLDLSFNLNYEIDDDTSNVKSSQPTIMLNISLWDSSFGNLSGSITYRSEMGDMNSEGNLGLNYSFPEYRNGNFSLSTSFGVEANIPGNKKMVDAEVVYETAGFDGRTVKIVQRDIGYDLFASSGVKYKLNVVQGLGVKLNFGLLNSYVPEYTVTENTHDEVFLESTKMESYKTSIISSGFSYKINDSMEFSTELALKFQGYFEALNKGYDDSRFENITSLVIKLF